jgi:hypothetical protein
MTSPRSNWPREFWYIEMVPQLVDIFQRIVIGTNTDLIFRWIEVSWISVQRYQKKLWVSLYGNKVIVINMCTFRGPKIRLNIRWSYDVIYFLILELWWTSPHKKSGTFRSGNHTKGPLKNLVLSRFSGEVSIRIYIYIIIYILYI